MEINQALLFTYNAKKARALTNLKVLLENPVGIGEHSDILTEAEKWIQEIAEADDCINAVEKYIADVENQNLNELIEKCKKKKVILLQGYL